MCVALESLCVLLEYNISESVIYVRIVLVGFNRVLVTFKSNGKSRMGHFGEMPPSLPLSYHF